jgi:sensor domain CHASE-containing protein
MHHMKLPKKTLLLLGLAFPTFVGILYSAASTILWHNVKQAEQENSRQVVAGVVSVLNQTQEDFGSRLADWATWDDTYAFIQNANKFYIKSNLDPQQLALVKLNLIAYINSSGQTVYGTGFDLKNKRKTAIPQALRQHLVADDILLKHLDKKSVLSGIALLPEGPMLISSHPILTSKGEGPIRGSLIFGRYVDNEVIEKLARTTRLSLTVHGFNQAQMPPDFQALRSSLSKKGTVVVRPVNEQTLAGYTTITDIYGQPSLLLRVDIPREIYQQGQNSQRYLIASLLLVSLVFGVVILLLLQRLVLFLKQRQKAEEKLLHYAFHDPLTGLANRALFINRLEHNIKLVKRHENYLFGRAVSRPRPL